MTMRKIIWDREISAASVAELLPRARQNAATVSKTVEEIIGEVRDRGIEAIAKHAHKFDGYLPVAFRVPASAMEEALANLDPELRAAIEESIGRVRRVSEEQLPKTITTMLDSQSSVTTQFLPFESVGVYVPGGKAVYPSSVVMSVVPAQAAGVSRIALCSPPKRATGMPDSAVLATAKLLGIEGVYAIGGASAIASFAYGLKEIDLQPVDLVTGPGNIFVATAKQQLKSMIAIDSEAGPTEILIIADSSANPQFVAGDLISQAEHDENAAAVLLTNSTELLEAVSQKLESLSDETPNRERVLTSLAGKQSALVLVPELADAVAIANFYAVEHLEIQTVNARELQKDIRHAGAVFIGDYSPVSLGDYLAGSNHVLPTSGNARRSAGLSVFSFLRPQQVVEYDRAGLEAVAGLLDTFAKAEGLPGHGEAARIRVKD
jgi:histidinol dehydrogenase